MFLLSQNDENQSENGSKNSKIRFRARPPAEPQKKMLQTKKLKKHGVFSLFACRVFSVLFFTVFFEGERHDLSKTGGFGRKMPPPPPGKPVTFYECHPDDHAPAPSVRADFFKVAAFIVFLKLCEHLSLSIPLFKWVCVLLNISFLLDTLLPWPIFATILLSGKGSAYF